MLPSWRRLPPPRCYIGWHPLTMPTLAFFLLLAAAQQTVIVRPKEIDDVLTNPGIGYLAAPTVTVSGGAATG